MMTRNLMGIAGRNVSACCFALLFLLTCAGIVKGAEPVWLDVDVATGLFTKDVDDGLAMIQAFHSPALEVRGVSVVFGNATLEQCMPIGQEILDRFGPGGLQAHAGAAGPEDLDRSTAASEALVRALEQESLTILALGPVTTIAAVVAERPDLHAKIRRIVMVAGRRPGQSFQTGSRPRAPLSDFNFEKDVEAMRILLDSDIELIFAPWEVSSKVWIRNEDLDELDASGGSGSWVASKARPWVLLWKNVFHATGFNPFDTLAVGYLTHPHLFDAFEGVATIESGEDDVAAYRSGGESEEAKSYLHVREAEDGERLVTYIHDVKAEAFRELLVERLKGESVSGGSPPGAIQEIPGSGNADRTRKSPGVQ